VCILCGEEYRVKLDIRGSRFVDEQGRTVILRGINLGGSTKLPSIPNGATHVGERFFDHRNVSFVDRPFPLEEADEHFTRLRSWGFTFLRFIVTWEAIEHAGPGLYDIAYLDYVEALVHKAGEHDIALHVDPHQDVWSRFTGGDGAPGWTLEAAGMDPARMHETGAAILHQLHGDPFPRMVWPTNVTKLGAATMFTLFFAGNDFAPGTRIEGEPAQDYLQRHYCAAMAQVAARLRGCSNVLGYETMNEPSHGLIGHGDLDRVEGLVKLGDSPTPYQSMLLGAGFPQEVPILDVGIFGHVRTGKRLLNPRGARLWREGADCIWRRHGVWDIGPDGLPLLLQPSYFTAVRGRAVDFTRDYYQPFANRFARAIRAEHGDAVIFIQTEVGLHPPRWGVADAPRIAFAPHWYDPVTIVLKRYYGLLAYNVHTKRLVLGRRAIRRSVAMQLAEFLRQAQEYLRGAPTILGETGVPFDLHDRKAYSTGDFRAQIAAVNRTMTGIESTLLSSCCGITRLTTTTPTGTSGTARTSRYSAATSSGTRQTPARAAGRWRPSCAPTAGPSRGSRARCASTTAAGGSPSPTATMSGCSPPPRYSCPSTSTRAAFMSRFPTAATPSSGTATS
jgi:hypothetical protein